MSLPIRSAGLLVFHRPSADVFLIRQRHGMFWGFPKGHIEEGETELQAAQRETTEETGLSPQPLPEFSQSISYTVVVEEARDAHGQEAREKQVTYFPAISGTRNFTVAESEVVEGGWYTVKQAHGMIPFPQLTELLDATVEWLHEQKYLNAT